MSQDMTQYHSWVESYDKKEETNQKGIETVREAEGDHSEAAVAAARGEVDGAHGKGSGKIGKPKPKPKPSTGPKAKTDEQLARAVSCPQFTMCIPVFLNVCLSSGLEHPLHIQYMYKSHIIYIYTTKNIYTICST